MWPNPQETTNLVTFAEEILNGKLYFLRSATIISFEWKVENPEVINILNIIIKSSRLMWSMSW